MSAIVRVCDLDGPEHDVLIEFLDPSVNAIEAVEAVDAAILRVKAEIEDCDYGDLVNALSPYLVRTLSANVASSYEF